MNHNLWVLIISTIIVFGTMHRTLSHKETIMEMFLSNHKRKKKDKILHHMVTRNQLHYPLNNILEFVPYLGSSWDELMITISFIMFHKNNTLTVEEIYAQSQYQKQYIAELGCYSTQEEKVIMETLEETRLSIDRILLWKEYGANKTVKRWYQKLLLEWDWTFMKFEDAYQNRINKMPFQRYAARFLPILQIKNKGERNIGKGKRCGIDLDFCCCLSCTRNRQFPGSLQ